MLFVLVFLVVFSAWIYAERKQRFGSRLGLGLASMVAIAFTSYWMGQVIPNYESSFHRRSLQRIGELLAKGETQRVQRAVQVYNTIATNRTMTYRASMELLHALNSDPKE